MKMGLGLRSITRSDRNEVVLPAEFEYVLSLSEFYQALGIPANEELRSFTFYDDKLTIRTRQVL
jgi:hypothetical protein